MEAVAAIAKVIFDIADRETLHSAAKACDRLRPIYALEICLNVLRVVRIIARLGDKTKLPRHCQRTLPDFIRARDRVSQHMSALPSDRKLSDYTRQTNRAEPQIMSPCRHS
jgi:hypothetical protein